MPLQLLLEVVVARPVPMIDLWVEDVFEWLGIELFFSAAV